MAISAAQVKELRERTGLGMLECKKALKETDGDIDLAIENLRKNSGLKAAKKADRTAADGVVAVKVAEDNSYAVVLEVNCETDFVARDESFLALTNRVLDKAFAERTTDIEAIMAGELEEVRQELVQKIGENMTVRRAVIVEGAMVDGYVHSNNRIASVVALTAGEAALAKDIAMHITAVNPRVVKGEDMSAEAVEKEKEIIKAQPDMEGKPAEIVEKMMVGRINKFLKENSLVEQPFVKNPELTVGKLAQQAGAEVLSFTRFEVGEGIEVEKKDFAQEVAEQLAGR
ncbi:translation elongation factor Ts [Litoribrevibacter albus]|uniref:Elongation factor Ts n=1 Tax=Litoribrevibacter albus TaxID=1473156 RepID=A0AA37SA02_9GAMM|nr:translation elongation factor Ts [Litoribrevibacter albus]GLQ31178.1 elongation factor Ts [Litoribrevibacter albus]